MRHERKPFMPVSNDVDDRLEQLAREKGVGKFEALPSRQGRGGGTDRIWARCPGSAAEPVTKAPTRLKDRQPGAPDYLWTELKIHAAHQQTSSGTSS